MGNKKQVNKGKKDEAPTGDLGRRKAVWMPEWNKKLNDFQMLQVIDLLKLIKEHKDAGVIGACVLATMYKTRIMPLQKRERFGFEYLGSNDPSRLTAEVLPSQMALLRVQRVLLDAHTVEYVPKLFSAGNPPKPGHDELYRCPAPNPDVPQAHHLRPSAFQVLKTHHAPASPLSKRHKDEGKTGPSGDDAAPELNVQRGAADPSAVDVLPSPSDSVQATTSQIPPKEPAGGSGKGTARGPRLMGLKKLVTKRSSSPSSALDLGDPKKVPAGQAPEQGKDEDVAAFDAGALPPPPLSPQATNLEEEKK
ncbi:hypothetical protein C2845_PMPSC048696 [Panicum miliaceum]|uniref:Uncharacterized protein n=1 Tax=Panicum miliaceum TaxID=4540 RepID=A0A3L6PA98_PANMI|nr:hypothetical protein C2845_PMPSC048696 [Panicum miliaceum]